METYRGLSQLISIGMVCVLLANGLRWWLKFFTRRDAVRLERARSARVAAGVPLPWDTREEVKI